MKITVFTPTYNRRKTLQRLYDSLLEQTCKEFEWLVVDDGSTDETERYIESLKEDNKINITYYKQKNKGKHIAHNRGVKMAMGELFFCVDSDDFLPHDAIKNIYDNIETLRETDCGFISGKVDEKNNLLCSNISSSLPHVGLNKLNSIGINGEFSFVFKTQILRNYLYPEIDNEKFIGESVLYDKLELSGYTLCPVPGFLTICEYQENGLTSIFYKLMLENPIGYKIYYKQRIDIALTFKDRINYCLRYNAFKRLGKKNIFNYYGKYNFLVAVSYIPSFLLYLYYYKRNKY